ncbi:MAG TPA: response regulator transcription factor [Streptosporangiaceae bacterium]
MVRVLIADDHPVVRAGLTGMLAGADGIEVAGEAGSGPEAVAAARRCAPDVVLMDLRMPGGGGAAAIARLSAELPRIRVLVLTTYDTDTDILPAIEAGATGYLLKDTPRDALLAAIRAAARGETVLAPAVAGRLLHRMREPAPGQLSPRETQVLALAARGLTNQEIAAVLYVSEATVKTHLLRACAKLGVAGRTAAVAKAIQSGALPAAGDGP